MCPRWPFKGTPPPGLDPSACDRPILGTYDDHDSGWNNGNRHLPDKHLMKQVFLDAMGVPQDSPRRNAARGIEWRTRLNAGAVAPGGAGDAGRSRAIDVYLLDERYHRDAIECRTRRAYCEELVLAPGSGFPDAAKAFTRFWCEDFLFGGEDGLGSCCTKDEEFFFGWCRRAAPAVRATQAFREACDPTDPAYGARNWRLGADGTTLELPDPSAGWVGATAGAAPFCDVLGRDQRQWLRESLAASATEGVRLNLVVSGSVLVDNALEAAEPCADGDPDGPRCYCTTDNFDCYRPAQINLLHTLARAPGCTLVLTGDHHYHDIKLVRPGPGTKYAAAYQTAALERPVFQVMSSGLSNGTAVGGSGVGSGKCDLPEAGRLFTGDRRADPSGLRPYNPELAYPGARSDCWHYTKPAFGAVEVDWERDEVRLQVRNETNGLVLESRLQISTCQPL